MAGAGFTQVPNSILRGNHSGSGPRLSPAARVLYGAILDYSNGGQRLCTASQMTLARYVDVTDRQIRNLLQELREAQVISVRREGRGITNTIIPLVRPTERKVASDHLRKSASSEQHLPESNTDFGSEGDEGSGSNNALERA